jgi:hypothetical protein
MFTPRRLFNYFVLLTKFIRSPLTLQTTYWLFKRREESRDSTFNAVFFSKKSALQAAAKALPFINALGKVI